MALAMEVVGQAASTTVLTQVGAAAQAAAEELVEAAVAAAQVAEAPEAVATHPHHHQCGRS